MTDRFHIKRHADGEYQVLVDGKVVAVFDNGGDALARYELEIKRELIRSERPPPTCARS
jgi:hypothetical protein